MPEFWWSGMELGECGLLASVLACASTLVACVLRPRNG